MVQLEIWLGSKTAQSQHWLAWTVSQHKMKAILLLFMFTVVMGCKNVESNSLDTDRLTFQLDSIKQIEFHKILDIILSKIDGNELKKNNIYLERSFEKSLAYEEFLNGEMNYLELTHENKGEIKLLHAKYDDLKINTLLLNQRSINTLTSKNVDNKICILIEQGKIDLKKQTAVIKSSSLYLYEHKSGLSGGWEEFWFFNKIKDTWNLEKRFKFVDY